MTRYQNSMSMSEAGSWLMGTMQRNPEGLLLMMAGLALMMRSGRNRASIDIASRARTPGAMAYPGSDYEPYGSEYDPYGQTEAPGRYSGRSTGSEFGSRASENMSNMARAGSESMSEMRDKVSGVAHDMSETASEYGSRLSDTASRYASRMSDTASEYGSRISETASDYASRMSDYAHEARRGMASAQHTVQSTFQNMMREQPLAIAAIGLVAGAAAAALIPTTRIEDQTLGSAADALTEAAYQTGEHMMEAASDAGERLRASAAEHGLSAQGLKEIASETVGAFKDSLTGQQHESSPSVVPETTEPVGGGPR